MSHCCQQVRKELKNLFVSGVQTEVLTIVIAWLYKLQLWEVIFIETVRLQLIYGAENSSIRSSLTLC